MDGAGPITERSERTAIQAAETWGPIQLLVVGLCFAINMVDGMDVLILSYIAPALQTDWGVGADRLGVVFSAGIVGMAIGGLGLAPLADTLGRRRLIVGALTLSTLAMIASGFVTTIDELLILRVLVGAGIGSVLASMAAIIAEYAPPKDRNFAVGLLYAGYPLGAILTGFIAAWAIPLHGWKAVLTGAGLVSAALLPFVVLLMPESVEFLVKRRPPRALERLNGLQKRMGRPPLRGLPQPSESPIGRTGLAGLFADGRAASTLLLWASMVSGFAALWFVISWIPKLAILSGLPPQQGIYAGAAVNAGAFAGTLVLGWLARKLRIQNVILVFLAAAALALVVFGAVKMSVAGVMATAFAIGVLLQGGFNGVYPLAARLYPAEVRSTGIGWTTGIGRIGAVIGPMVGGILLEAKTPLPILFAIFAGPALVGGICAFLVRLPDEAAARD